MYNPSSIVDDSYQFDFFQGGGLDMTFLGFAQIDQYGNVNSSRFGDALNGCGGFIDISQNSKKVVFCGSFAVKSQQEITEKGLEIRDPGKVNKFIKNVEQITFSGEFALEKGQEVLYITERALFQLTSTGLLLKEIAPGVDLEKDILNMMDFKPIIDDPLKIYDADIFKECRLGLLQQ